MYMYITSLVFASSLPFMYNIRANTERAQTFEKFKHKKLAVCVHKTQTYT